MKKHAEQVASANIWDKIAAIYDDRIGRLSYYDESYDALLQLLESKKSPSVLEIGCGPGNIARYVLGINKNIKYLATDLSEKMLAEASKNIPAATFQRCAALEIDEIPQKFDGIIAGFVIPFLSESELGLFFQKVKKILNPKGLFYLSFVPGSRELSGIKRNKDGDKLFFNFHELNSVHNLFTENNFQILWQSEVAFPRPEGNETHKIFIAQNS